jgi:hypothetical protein
MPISIRKDDASKRVAVNILGPPQNGLTDSSGNKKRFVKKKDKNNFQEEKTNRFEEIGYF